MSAFEFGENDKISLIALIAKANSVDPNTNRNTTLEIFDTLTRRLTTEKLQIMNTMKLKLVDNIIKYRPHFAIRSISEMCIQNTMVSKTLIAVIDTSGSMSSVIKSMQIELKSWIDQSMRDQTYDKCVIIFFGSSVHGPFYDTSCLNIIHESGGTYVIPALRLLQSTLNIVSKNTNADVIFITDGEFHEGKSAYNFGMFDSIDNFVMIFPDHTPESAVCDHSAYLPRITQPNTPIYSLKKSHSMTFNQLLQNKLVGSCTVSIEKTLYTPICGEYLMLTGLSLFQMNSIVELILRYPSEESAYVHNFFSYIMGVYNAMATKGGDLLNTLRSVEMKLLWQLLQPLKKTLLQVATDNPHYTTTNLVYEFLESYESEIVARRDERINELKKRGNSKEILDEIASIRQSFECMKRVDEFDRITIEIERLKSRGNKSIFVKFNYIAKLSTDAFKGFPNLSKSDVCEIYRSIASICIERKIDENVHELVLDPHGNGLILILRLLTFKKNDANRMTLTATLASRMLFGFFVNQMIRGYEHTSDHNEIKLLLWKHTMNFYSEAILFNMTNMNEPINTSPEWIKILSLIATITDIKIKSKPSDMTLWQTEENYYKLNCELLRTIEARNTALIVYRTILGFGSKLSAHVNNRYFVNIKSSDVSNFILKVSGEEQKWYEWKDCPLRNIVLRSGEVLVVTNGMDLQERIHINVDDFLQMHFELGHPSINKAGISHPATIYGTGQVKQSVHTWFLDFWAQLLKNYPEFQHLSRYKLPTVITKEEFIAVRGLIKTALESTPIYYDKIHTEQIPAWLIAKKTNIFDEEIIQIINEIQLVTDFNKLSGEQQLKTVQKLENKNRTLTCDIPELVNGALTLVPELVQKFQPNEVVSGVGNNICKNKKRADKIFELLELDDFNLSEFLNMNSDDKLNPDDFMCPISGELLVNPVMFDGHIYERSCLEQWFKTSRSSPLTRRTHNDDGTLLQLTTPPTIFMKHLEKIRMVNK